MMRGTGGSPRAGCFRSPVFGEAAEVGLRGPGNLIVQETAAATRRMAWPAISGEETQRVEEELGRF
jgi:hypothetical protein